MWLNWCTARTALSVAMESMNSVTDVCCVDILIFYASFCRSLSACVRCDRMHVCLCISLRFDFVPFVVQFFIGITLCVTHTVCARSIRCLYIVFRWIQPMLGLTDTRTNQRHVDQTQIFGFVAVFFLFLFISFFKRWQLQSFRCT